jgi:hypothetical protein
VDLHGLARAARRRLRSAEAGALAAAASAAAAAGVAGRRTPFVLTHEGRPLLPPSPGLRPGDRVCLSVEGEGAGEAARVVVEGGLREASPAEAARFGAFQPGLGVLCLEPEAVRVEGAAGEVGLAPAEFLLAEPAWKHGEAEILRHMNEDHEDAMLRMSRHFHGVEAERAELVAVDPEGLHVRTDRGVLYFPFDRLCASHEDVHQATVHLARSARLALARSDA